MIPSIKTIESRLGIDHETAKLARAIMEGGAANRELRETRPELFPVTIAGVDRGYLRTGVERALSMLNDLLGGCGVEGCGHVDMHDGPPLEYVNQGDTYTPTICRFRGRWMVCCWGDIVEKYPEQFGE